MLRKVNTWYAVNDGNWSNPNTWLSNGQKKHLTPQLGDNVYINSVVTIDNYNATINNLYVSGLLKWNGVAPFTLTINGDCQVSGSGLIDLSSHFNKLVFNGYNNIIPATGFQAGSYSTIIYNAPLPQTLVNIQYRNLTTQNGAKYQTSDVSVLGNFFTDGGGYEVNIYNLTVYGTSQIGNVGTGGLSKNSNIGSLLFVGSVDFEGNTDLSTGNSNVEFRGGFIIHTFKFISGSGTFTFSTNNQSANFSAYLGGSWAANIIIEGAIVLTWIGNSTVPITGIINGTLSSSTLNNSGTLYLGNSIIPMSTGTFNYQYTSSSTIGYIFDGSYTLPYTSYSNLVIDGTGTKAQSGNTTINQTLLIRGDSYGCSYECNGYNLTVEGAFTNQGGFLTNAFCNILFIGLATWGHYIDSSTGVDLRTGNPNIEFRDGLTLSAYFTYTGTGIFRFTTNNQNIDFSINNAGVWDSAILISGAISITFLGSSLPLTIVKGVLNGDNANSTFINTGTFLYANAQQPMQTGQLWCNQAVNTFIYDAAANQNITVPSDTSPGYQNLTLTGSGAKRLLGNISVKGIYTLISPATLNSNSFSLTNP